MFGRHNRQLVFEARDVNLLRIKIVLSEQTHLRAPHVVQFWGHLLQEHLFCLLQRLPDLTQDQADLYFCLLKELILPTVLVY